MFSVLEVFYKDLWLQNACRKVKWSGHSSASCSSTCVGAHVGKQEVGEAEALHFQPKGVRNKSQPLHLSWVWWQDPFGFSHTTWQSQKKAIVQAEL